MNILVVGVCDQPQSTNTFMVNAFKNLGHEVDVYNYRTVASAVGIEDMNLDLSKYLFNSAGPPCYWDLVIFCKTDTLYWNTINLASQLYPTFYFFMDPLQTAQGMQANLLAREARYVSATTTEVVQFFKDTGSKNVSRIIEGVDISLYQPMPIDKRYDVAFIGSKTDKRENIIRYIRSKGVSVHINGNGWSHNMGAGPPVYNIDLVKTISASKIVLNFVHGDSYSDRVTLTLAAGGFLLSEHADDIENEYKIGDHLTTWKTLQELCDKLDHYLSNFMARESIARDGCVQARKYTWERTCKQILGVVNGENNKDSK